MVGDAELAVAAASGDRAALADIYDRYADSLHELCRAVLHDAHEASDAVHDTFVIASTRLGQLRDPDRLKPWLFAIARRESIRRSSKRARMRPSHDEVLDVPVVDDTAGGAMADDAARLVWEAANALTERERAVLVLNVRQGLEGADLADAAGLPGPQASVVLSRAKTQLASAVRCTLLLRNGRADCGELSQIVPQAHRMLDGLTRKRVARHAQGCKMCEPKWNASPNALGILAAAPLLGAPAALKQQVLDDAQLIGSSKPLGGGGWRRDGFPPDEEKRRRRPLIASIAAALVLFVIAVGLVLAGNDESPTLSATDRTEATTTTSSVFVLGVTDTTVVIDVTSTTTRRATTTTTRRGATTTRPRPASGGAPATTPPTAPPTTPTTAASLSIATRGPSSMTTCAPATFSATTSGPSSQLYVHYRGASGGGSKNMSPSGGNTWSAAVSVGTPGDYTWYVSTNAFGTGGTSSASKPLTVTACPQ